MPYVYVFFIVCVMDDNAILSGTIKQNFNILRRLIGKISNFEFDDYREFSLKQWPKTLCWWCT